MRDFELVLVQMRVERDKAENLARAGREIAEAARLGADLVVLPEMFCCPYDVDNFAAYSEPLGEGPTCEFLAHAAAEHQIHVVGGSFPERDGDRLYNTATLYDPSGALLLCHRKVHLFDIDIPGGIRFRESDVLDAGDRVSVAETELGTVGLAICYDLRFPELFRAMTLAGAELIVLPGAFNTTTGPAHWRSLLEVRAVENTVFVAACSPAPHPEGRYPAWGHSMVVDPFGAVLSECERDEAVVHARIEATRLDQVRRGLPVLEQRRPEVYGASEPADPAPRRSST